MIFLRSLGALAALVVLSLAQTPADFQPGTQVNMGVLFPNLEVNPSGVQIPSLNLAAVVPRLSVAANFLMTPSGQMNMTKKFMVFLVDPDFTQGNVATTVLHWFQPDLLPDGDSVALFGNASSTILLKQQDSTTQEGSSVAGTTSVTSGTRAQAVYFGPRPPPGPAHRFVFLLFAQPDNFKFPECFQNILAQSDTMGVRPERIGFDINQFLMAGGVNSGPIAGNFFVAQNPTPGTGQKPTMSSLLSLNCAAQATGAAANPQGPPAAPPVAPPAAPSAPPAAPPVASPAAPSASPAAPPVASPAAPSASPAAPPVVSPAASSASPAAPPVVSPAEPSAPPEAPPVVSPAEPSAPPAAPPVAPPSAPSAPAPPAPPAPAPPGPPIPAPPAPPAAPSSVFMGSLLTSTFVSTQTATQIFSVAFSTQTATEVFTASFTQGFTASNTELLTETLQTTAISTQILTAVSAVTSTLVSTQVFSGVLTEVSTATSVAVATITSSVLLPNNPPAAPSSGNPGPQNPPGPPNPPGPQNPQGPLGPPISFPPPPPVTTVPVGQLQQPNGVAPTQAVPPPAAPLVAPSAPAQVAPPPPALAFPVLDGAVELNESANPMSEKKIAVPFGDPALVPNPSLGSN